MVEVDRAAVQALQLLTSPAVHTSSFGTAPDAAGKSADWT